MHVLMDRSSKQPIGPSCHTIGPTAEFHLADTHPRDDSGESVMTDSDLEGSDVEEWSPADTSRYYWFGKRVFEGILNHVVFDESESRSTGEDLEVSSHRTKSCKSIALIGGSPP